jgi:hypothetical protein
MRLRRHLGDGVLDVCAAVAGTSFGRYRRSIGRTRGSWLGRFVVLSHHTLLILTVGKALLFAGMKASVRGTEAAKEAGNGAKYMIFLD